jgi:hypothetical protein
MARTAALVAAFAAILVLASWIFVPADASVGASTPASAVAEGGGGPEAAMAISLASAPIGPAVGF